MLVLKIVLALNIFLIEFCSIVLLEKRSALKKKQKQLSQKIQRNNIQK